MGYQPRAGAPQDYGQRHERSGHEKAKSKAEKKRQRSSRSYVSEEKHVPTPEEAAGRILNNLRILGSQRFALPPFYEHFDRWLANLGDVLSEFESSPAIYVDERYMKERSKTVSNINVQLKKVQRNEASREEAAKKFSENKSLLGRIEKEYAAKSKEVEERKNRETSKLSRDVDSLREELNRTAQTKTGIFGFLKKTERPKEAEATQKLNLAQKYLRLAETNFAAEQEQLRDEYEKLKQLVTGQILDLQKEAENEEIDFSLEHREAACESLANAVNALIQRKKQETAEKKIKI
jgi:hypothetical protein